MTITWSMVAWAAGILGAWTGLLLGIINYLLKRQIAAFETKLSEADAKAEKANKSLADHKQSITNELATLRIEFNQKSLCGNHQRMEDNDTRLFKRLDQLHGDIRELVGGVNGLAKSLEMVNEHLLNGGK